jgi:hypothetical protein
MSDQPSPIQPPPGYSESGAMPPPYPQEYWLQPGMPGPLYLTPPNSLLATVSMVFGILSIIALPIIGSLVAIICGHMALIEIKRSQGRFGGRGLALTGIILGYITIILDAALILTAFAYLAYLR